MVHLVTGYAGREHIKSADQGSFNAAFFGSGQFVMEIGQQISATVVDNNTVRIYDGDILMKGRHIRIQKGTYEDVSIESGTAGYNRIDLICMTYSKDVSSEVETASLEVIKGSPSAGTAIAPGYTDGDILGNASKNQMPLYKVEIEGVALKKITALFTTCPTYKKLAEQYAAQFEQACNTYIGALNILDSMSAINSNSKTNQLAGALALKELASTVATKQNASTAITTSNISSQTVSKANSVPWSGVTGKPSTYAPSSHNHDDRYYTESEVNSLLGGKANSSHTHDDRYYTESEVNSLLGGKASTSDLNGRVSDDLYIWFNGNNLGVKSKSRGITYYFTPDYMA